MNILLVDDEEFILNMLEAILKDIYAVHKAKNGVEALSVIHTHPIDIVLLDLNLPGMSGLEVLKRIKDHDSSIGIIMLSAVDRAEQAVSALKKGAYDYITKPFNNDDLLSTLSRLSDQLKLKSEVEYLKEVLAEKQQEEYGCGDIVSKSTRMMKIFEIIKAVSSTSSTVLITGESGTGKELIARAIHKSSTRNDKPFIAINCGAVPENLIESEFFGHERGAFTGAHQRKIGRLEYAHNGTIFLDEVSTLPMHLQVKLLRVLQERSFERIGANQPIKVDIRVIAASNVKLDEEVRKGRFREDLYFRLNVVPIKLPPLRDRKEDIPLLVNHFLKKHANKCGKQIQGILPNVLSIFMKYPWPGNIRELENLMERLVVLSPENGVIATDDLPAEMLFSPDFASSPEIHSFRDAVKTFEKNYIINALERKSWNRLETAKTLKIHRNTLFFKMRELEIIKN